MDKNTIHIDDLVRQRLVGEEEERAGAWLRMKDLLDKDMPNKAAGFPWRKTLVSAAVVVALATAGITAYEVSSSFRGTAVGNNVDNAAHPSFATNKVTNTTNTAATTNTNSELPAVDNQSNTVTTSGESTIATTTNDNISANTTKTIAHLKPTQKTNSANKTEKTSTAANNISTASGTNTVKGSVAKNNNINQPQQTTSPTSTSPGTSPKGNNNQNENGTLVAADATVPGNQRSTADAKGTDTKKVPFIEHTTMSRINPITGEVTVDRTLTDKGIVEIPVLVAQEPLLAASAPKEVKATPKEIIPYGPPPDTYEYPQATANATTHKAKEHKKAKSGGWDFQWFNDFLDRTEIQLGQTQVSTGIIGGLNSTFGNYGMRGFNVGLYTNFEFNPFWSVKVEGKYMQRFNNNANTYDNDYTTYTQDANGMFTHEEKRHFFKYSTASSLEMPVMLKYTNRKMMVFGGANLAYFFNIKAEETERATLVGSVAAPQQTTAPMTLADFNSRFGMGYVFGAGYQFNKQVGIDLRVTQTLWDNAKGTGAQQISKDLYKTPSGQVTLSYRFGGNKK